MAIGNPINLTSNVEGKSISVSATAGQTQFTVTGGYRINQISVYRNGVRLVDGRDFTATDGSIVTLLSAASVDDVVEFQVFDDFRVSDALNVNSGGTVNGDVTVNGALTVSSTFTGTATTATNAQGLTGSPDIAVTNITAGIITATTFSGNGSALTGVASTDNIITGTAATFTSDVNIADSIIHVGDTNTKIRFPAADTFTVETAGSEALRVQSDGDVGIGTINNSNNERLRVQDDATTSTSCQLSIISGNAERAILNFGDKEDANIGRVTYDNSDNHLSLFTNNTEAIRIDSSQRLLVNTATTRTNYDNGSVTSNLLHVERTAASGNAGISICANAATAADVGAILYMGRTSATSNGGSTIVEDDDLIGRISFQGADGSQLVEAASIICDVDGTPGADDMPGRIEFHTTADGGSGATERMRIMSDGTVKIGTGTGNPILMLNASTSGTSVIQMGDSADNNIGQIQYANSDDSMKFFANNAERLRINSDGEVGIGTDDPQQFVHIHDEGNSGIVTTRIQQVSSNTPTDGGAFLQLGGTRSTGTFGHYGGIFGGNPRSVSG